MSHPREHRLRHRPGRLFDRLVAACRPYLVPQNIDGFAIEGRERSSPQPASRRSSTTTCPSRPAASRGHQLRAGRRPGPDLRLDVDASSSTSPPRDCVRGVCARAQSGRQTADSSVALATLSTTPTTLRPSAVTLPHRPRRHGLRAARCSAPAHGSARCGASSSVARARRSSLAEQPADGHRGRDVCPSRARACGWCCAASCWATSWTTASSSRTRSWRSRWRSTSLAHQGAATDASRRFRLLRTSQRAAVVYRLRPGATRSAGRRAIAETRSTRAAVGATETLDLRWQAAAAVLDVGRARPARLFGRDDDGSREPAPTDLRPHQRQLEPEMSRFAAAVRPLGQPLLPNEIVARQVAHRTGPTHPSGRTPGQRPRLAQLHPVYVDMPGRPCRPCRPSRTSSPPGRPEEAQAGGRWPSACTSRGRTRSTST